MDIIPTTFKKKKKTYIHNNDPILQFVEEFCDISPDFRVPVTGFQTKLRKEYGLTPLEFTSQNISKIMFDKGFEKNRQRVTYAGHCYNTQCYVGIRIKPAEEEEEF